MKQDEIKKKIEEGLKRAKEQEQAALKALESAKVDIIYFQGAMDALKLLDEPKDEKNEDNGSGSEGHPSASDSGI